jgi:hypothetical protein
VFARSERERFWWRVAAALVGAIVLSAYFVQFVVAWLFERNLLRVAIAAGFAVVAAGIVGYVARRGATWRSWAVLAVVAGAYAGAALGLDVVQERIHLVEYGAVALVCRAALAERAAADPAFGFRSVWAASAGALALAFAAGYLDELVQAALPNRHYDLRDVGLNTLAAAMALVAARWVESTLEPDR